MSPDATEQQLAQYETDGYLLLESFIDTSWLTRLNAKVDELIDESRTASRGDWRFDFEPDHTPDSPRLRRIQSPVETSSSGPTPTSHR